MEEKSFFKWECKKDKRHDLEYNSERVLIIVCEIPDPECLREDVVEDSFNDETPKKPVARQRPLWRDPRTVGTSSHPPREVVHRPIPVIDVDDDMISDSDGLPADSIAFWEKSLKQKDTAIKTENFGI